MKIPKQLPAQCLANRGLRKLSKCPFEYDIIFDIDIIFTVIFQTICIGIAEGNLMFPYGLNWKIGIGPIKENPQRSTAAPVKVTNFSCKILSQSKPKNGAVIV